MTKKSAGFLIPILALVFLLVPFFTANAAEGDKPTWEWSAKNPKPGWFEWGPKYSKDKPFRGGYFRKASPVYIGLLNPNHWPVMDWVAITEMYEMLTYSNGAYYQDVPWLASSWETPNNTTYITHLRKGVKFHDGSDFNAESLKYQMDWIMNKMNGAWTRSYAEPIESIEIIDEYTVKWNLKRPFGAFMAIVMNGVLGMAMSEKALIADAALKNTAKLERKVKKIKKKIAKAEKKGQAERVEKAKKDLAAVKEEYNKVKALAAGAKPLDNHAVGTGAFMHEEGNPGNYYKMKRNPNWWFGQSISKPEMPYFDGQITYVIPDPSVRLANLRANKIDTMLPDVSQYELIKKNKNLVIHTHSLNWTYGLTMNQAKGRPGSDIRVRKAISHAIDRKAIVHGVLFNKAREASSLFPGDHWAHNPNIEPIKYDPELSRKLLKEAGYENGLTITGTYANSPGGLSTAEAIKNMLAKVGITWEIEFLDLAPITEKMRNLEYDLMGLLWVWIWDPDAPAYGLYHPTGMWNYGRVKNQKAVALVEAGRLETERTKRQQIYHDLEQAITDNYDDIFISWGINILVYSDRVQGYNNQMNIDWRQGYVYSHPMWFKDGKNTN